MEINTKSKMNILRLYININYFVTYLFTNIVWFSHDWSDTILIEWDKNNN